jgi:lipid-A-disaccharide synthase
LPKTLFFLAGEASGDLHAAKLLQALKSLRPDLRALGLGGPRLAAAGLQAVKDLEGMQVMGFWEVARRLGFFRRVFRELRDRVKQERPDAVVCIDYPGFNLRFAAAVSRLNIPVLYYILPQVWAWNPGRAARMAEVVDRAYCVFDFEPPFFQKAGGRRARMKTRFVGHPLLDQPPPPKVELPPGPPVAAFLPGSRGNEFRAHWKPMCRAFALARERVPGIRGLLSIAPGIPSAEAGAARRAFPAEEGADAPRTPESPVLLAPRSFAESAGGLFSRPECATVSPATLLASVADFCVSKSGTSTLESALQGKPLCVVYRGSFLSYSIAHLVVEIPVISLVNIVLGRCAVREFIQDEVSGDAIARELARGLTDEKYAAAQRAALAELPRRLGGPGASRRAAEAMMAFLEGRE